MHVYYYFSCIWKYRDSVRPEHAGFYRQNLTLYRDKTPSCQYHVPKQSMLPASPNLICKKTKTNTSCSRDLSVLCSFSWPASGSWSASPFLSSPLLLTVADEVKPGGSDVSPLSGISGLPVWSHFSISPLVLLPSPVAFSVLSCSAFDPFSLCFYS